MDEKPTVEEVKAPEKPTGAEDVQSLLSELNKIGATTPEKVQNMARASQEAGNLARILGEQRKINERLLSEVQALKTKGTYDEQSIDLGSLIDQKLTAHDQKRMQMQMEASRQVMGEMASIRGDEDYSMVSEIFEKHINSPATIFSIQTGQTTPSQEYAKMVRQYYRTLLKRSKDTISTLGTSAATATPPHMETGGVSPPVTNVSVDEKQERLKQAQKGWAGTDRDIERLIDAVLPKGDLTKMRYGS